ncbi:MAG: hypothetical protein U0525_06070 [Patescibacteria group bacterium]
MSGIVESIGALGIAPRSDKRVVATLSHSPTMTELRSVLRLRNEIDGTRVQVKYLGYRDSRSRNIEGVLTPSLGDHPHGVVFMGRNNPDRSGDVLGEWQQVREYWQKPLETRPDERISSAVANGFTLTTQIQASDIGRLSQIWTPFGWTEDGVVSFANSYRASSNYENGWFCGVRNSAGVLCAAAKAEGLALTDDTGTSLNMVESTEWGTHPDSRRMGLGTVAAIGLNAQILSHPPQIPFSVFAEANMAPNLPGHKVARDAGFVSRADFDSQTPNGVLPQHVSVDGALRNFLLVQLTPDSIRQYYPDDFLSYMSQITK